MSDPNKLAEKHAEWRRSFDELPDNGPIPSFYFGHGSPVLFVDPNDTPQKQEEKRNQPLYSFLKEFGPFLLRKYNPKAIVVFSAHWETEEQRLVSDYGDDQPLLMDYFRFPQWTYEVKFKSRGDRAISDRVVELFKKHGQSARITTRTEARGRDGRGFDGPGLDHGVFIPFRIMFGEEFTEIPIIMASMDSSMDPEVNWNIGKALAELRSEGILILSGGLDIHTFNDFSAFSENTAKAPYKEFHQAVLEASQQQTPELRHTAMINLASHRYFRLAHPREDHFVPIYVAAGAGEAGKSKIISGMYGAPTIAFGLA